MMKSANVLMGVLAIAGLSLSATGASAQAFYVDPYLAPMAPEGGYVVRQTVVAPPPLVRERTIVVSRPTYVPVVPVPLPRYGYAPERYIVTDW